MRTNSICMSAYRLKGQVGCQWTLIWHCEGKTQRNLGDECNDKIGIEKRKWNSSSGLLWQSGRKRLGTFCMSHAGRHRCFRTSRQSDLYMERTNEEPEGKWLEHGRKMFIQRDLSMCRFTCRQFYKVKWVWETVLLHARHLEMHLPQERSRLGVYPRVLQPRSHASSGPAGFPCFARRPIVAFFIISLLLVCICASRLKDPFCLHCSYALSISRANPGGVVLYAQFLHAHPPLRLTGNTFFGLNRLTGQYSERVSWRQLCEPQPPDIQSTVHLGGSEF